MTKRQRRSSRHIPAYILLFLTKGDLYGKAVFDTMKKEMPCLLVGSSVIYRTLHALEKEGSVKSYWETETPGPARKWYAITDRGYKKLAELKNDIEKRKRNFDFFLREYAKINR